jgi:hypothetical protein
MIYSAQQLQTIEKLNKSKPGNHQDLIKNENHESHMDLEEHNICVLGYN